jgi:hypothetical protein
MAFDSDMAYAIAAVVGNQYSRRKDIVVVSRVEGDSCMILAVGSVVPCG